MVRVRSIASIALATVAVLMMAGCSSSDEPEPLSDDQAAALSQVLVRNLEAGGADVVATVDYGPDSQLVLDGVIDWVEHGGRGELTTTVDGTVTERTDVAWTESEVAVRPAGSGDDEWVYRAADPDAVPLDRVIALIVASAGPERDNPLLVAQSDARALGTERVDDGGVERDVDVIDGGGRLVFRIGVDDGLLYRLDADIEGFDGLTTLEFRDHRPIDLGR